MCRAASGPWREWTSRLQQGAGAKPLTEWPGIDENLVQDEDVTQMGEREALGPHYAQHFGDIRNTTINRIIVQDMLRDGMPAIAKRVAAWTSPHELSRYWLHLDVDVLAEAVMPAVDSPGLDFEQVARLVSLLIRHVPVIGDDVTIYDPDEDPDRGYAGAIVECLGKALGRPGRLHENGCAVRRRRTMT